VVLRQPVDADWMAKVEGMIGATGPARRALWVRAPSHRHGGRPRLRREGAAPRTALRAEPSPGSTWSGRRARMRPWSHVASIARRVDQDGDAPAARRPAPNPAPRDRRRPALGRHDLKREDEQANKPAVVFEPPASLGTCARCQEAYAQARKVIEDAGGIAKWLAEVDPLPGQSNQLAEPSALSNSSCRRSASIVRLRALLAR
jgi:hypothetical protein